MPDVEVINIALHGALLEPFQEWLAGRNCHLSLPIPLGDGDAFCVVVPNSPPRG